MTVNDKKCNLFIIEGVNNVIHLNFKGFLN